MRALTLIRPWDSLVVASILGELGDPERENWWKLREESDANSGNVIGLAVYRGYVTSKETLAPNQWRWFFGPYGWLLSDVRRLPEPVWCRGQLGLWTLPTEVEAKVRAQL